MINIAKEKCSGCYACYNVCPKKCITMKLDIEGFWYPSIDEISCIDCHLCEQVCPAFNLDYYNSNSEAYICFNKNQIIRESSSSGGIFYLLAEYILSHKGVVFGAAFNKDFEVQHICIDSLNQIPLLMRSKYVQSNIGVTYQDAEKYLNQGKFVLFAGTPCQIDGLLHYLKKDYEKLYTQDIICHGVPSPKIWKQYLKMQSKKYHSSLQDVNFRCKDHGWSDFSMKLIFENGKVYNKRNDFFLNGFLANHFLRLSCHYCDFKSKYRNSDITLADCWGIKEMAPDLYDENGVSLILVNSEKGKNLFRAIESDILYRSVDYDLALEYNSAAIQSSPIPPERDRFVSKLSLNGFTFRYRIYWYNKSLRKLLGKVKRKMINLFRLWS